MKKLVKHAAVAGLVLAAFSASAADITIGGTITPGACTLSLTGAAVDHGTQTAPQFAARGEGLPGYKALDWKTVGVSVACPAATRVALQFTDNRASARPTIDGFDIVRFGIADSSNGGAVLGYSYLYSSSLTIDGVAPAGILVTPNNGNGWTASAHPPFIGNNEDLGFVTAVGNAVPDAITTIGGELGLESFVSAAYVSSATNTVTIDGSIGVTLRYL